MGKYKILQIPKSGSNPTFCTEWNGKRVIMKGIKANKDKSYQELSKRRLYLIKEVEEINGLITKMLEDKEIRDGKASPEDEELINTFGMGIVK